MKKISLYIAMVMAMVGIVSCSQDRDPVYHVPTSFTLNVPAMQDQLIELTENGTLELTCSQPNYGFAAAAVYSAQMSLTEDFAESYDLTPLNENVAKMQIPQSQVATGYCELLGVTSEEDYQTMYPDGFEATKIYFRAVCQIAGIDSSRIESNVVSYNQVLPYFNVAVPGYIYLVGAPEGWKGPDEANAAHYAEWRLFEADDAIGSKVYSGVFDIPAGDSAMFRFYTALTGWDADSYGVQVDDNAVQFPDAFADGTFTHQLIKGKGSFWFPNWEGGKMTIVVDMSDPNNMVVTMTEGEVEVVTPMYIYGIGNQFGNWTEPSEANQAALTPYRLTSTDGGHIYSATLPVTAGDLYMRFAVELGGWDGPQIGIQEVDESIECQFTNGAFSGPYVSGKGSWYFNVPEDGNISLTVDMDNQTVNFVLE